MRVREQHSAPKGETNIDTEILPNANAKVKGNESLSNAHTSNIQRPVINTLFLN